YAREAAGLRGELVLLWRGRCALRLRLPRHGRTGGLQSRPLVPDPVHGDHRGRGDRARVVPWERVRCPAPGAPDHHGPLSRQQPWPAYPPKHDFEPRTDAVRRLYNLLSDRGAAWARPALADREGEAAAVAVPALIGARGAVPRVKIDPKSTIVSVH